MNDIPLIVHLTYALDFGGLENLMVERINRMPAERYRHAVVCLARANPAFTARISKPGVTVHVLDKQPGLSLGTHKALWALLRDLQPAVLHTYNLAAIEYGPAALLAGVPVRVNGAHGRDHTDPEIQGRYQWGVVEHVGRGQLDGEEGWGLFEHGTIGRHDPTGFADYFSVAP